MLHQLNFDVTFASTGRNLKGEHCFKTGLSAITGPNESGKSLRLEMIRFALWGTKALRSSATSYRNLEVTLSFRVGEVDYTVHRKKNNAHLFRGSLQIATGTSPVNAEIERTFGYGITVFDTANACLQGEVEALSKMTATDRKKMVDKIIGLDAIDDLIKEVSSEVSTQKNLVDVIERQIVPEIAAPEMPEDYSMVSEELSGFITSTMALVIEKNKVETMIMALNCDHPGPQPVFTVEQPIGDLIGQKIKYDSVSNQNVVLSTKLLKLKQIKNSDLSSEDLNKIQEYLDMQGPELWAEFDEYHMRAKTLKDKLPSTSLDTIKLYIQYLDVAPSVKKIKELEEHKISCPECAHEFPLMNQAIAELRLNIPQSWDVEKVAFDYANSGYTSLSQLLSDKQNWEIYNLFMEKPEPSPPNTTLAGDRKSNQAILDASSSWMKAQEEIKEVAAEIENVMVVLRELSGIDFDQKISTREAEEKALSDYTTNEKNYKKFQDYVAETRDWLKNLEFAEDDLAKYRRLHGEAVAFENAVDEWKFRTAQNEKMKGELSVAVKRLDELTRVRKSLQDLKPLVKKFLVPSLNRVASNLLSQMTNGQRNIIDVNEEFEITVDNQPIDELSGSGKAVANLAIRIGLGTVLTNRVFSVLLADEVDAAMDKERAAHTAECLRNLTKTFQQIILVSHQKPEADHQIEV